MAVSRGLDEGKAKTTAVVGVQAATAGMIRGVRAASKIFSAISTSGEKSPNTASSDRPRRACRICARGGSGPGAASARKALPARPGEPETGPKGAAAPGVPPAALSPLRGSASARQCRARRSRTDACVEQGRNRRRKRERHGTGAGPGASADARAVLSAGTEEARGRSCGRCGRGVAAGARQGAAGDSRHERSEPPPHRRGRGTVAGACAFA